MQNQGNKSRQSLSFRKQSLRTVAVPCRLELQTLRWQCVTAECYNHLNHGTPQYSVTTTVEDSPDSIFCGKDILLLLKVCWCSCILASVFLVSSGNILPETHLHWRRLHIGDKHDERSASEVQCVRVVKEIDSNQHCVRSSIGYSRVGSNPATVVVLYFYSKLLVHLDVWGVT